MKSRFIYWLVYSGMWLFSALPFRILYLLSDFNYLLMYRIGRYRRKVVRENLKKSFPEKDKKERLQIERRFYRYLSDYMLEDLKMLHMSPEDLYKRMTYKNTEQYLELTEKYGGIIVMIPHYANYEWLIGMGSIMKPGDVPMQVYKPLKDKYLNELFQRIRSRFGGYNVPKHSTAREIIKLKREGKKMVVGLITDQWPSGNEKYWTTFLGQETAFLNGAERIAKMMNFPVFYCDLTKPGRGYCVAEFKLMTEKPKCLPEGWNRPFAGNRLIGCGLINVGKLLRLNVKGGKDESVSGYFELERVRYASYFSSVRDPLFEERRSRSLCGRQWLYGCFCGNASGGISLCPDHCAGSESWIRRWI